MTLYKQLSITVFCIFTLVFGMAFYFVLMAVKDEYAATERQHFVQLADQLSFDLQPIISEPQWPAAWKRGYPFLTIGLSSLPGGYR